MLTVYTGALTLGGGESVELPVRLLLTPVRGGELHADFATRYFHMQRYTTVAQAVAAAPEPWIILHQGNQLNPYINYPFLTVEPLRRHAAEASDLWLATLLACRICVTLLPLKTSTALLPHGLICL